MEISIYIFFVIGILEAVLANMSKIEAKIVGGALASRENFSHSAFLLMQCNPQAHMCGSSILNQAFLLTAGHCVDECKIGYTIFAFLGETKSKSGLKIAVNTFKKHEQFNRKPLRNDLAIVMLASPIKLGHTMSRVAIMAKPPRENVAYVAGWGQTDEDNYIRGVHLKYAKQLLWDRKECFRALHKKIRQNVICAGADRNYYGHAARGDSGSALIVRGYIQIGLVSFNVPARRKDVNVYTDTSQYLEWIQNQTGILNCKPTKQG